MSVLNTLYIDIDDTLVTWLSDTDEPHPYGHSAKGWKMNEKVYAYANAWVGKIVVWSGGGKDYAEMWANRLLPDLEWTAHSKFPAIAKLGDVFIDDMPFDVWRHATIHPNDL